MSSVSVVIPCYNYAHFLPDAVRSALDHQPGVDVSVLIIDDASSDDSAQVARGIATSDPRVTFRQHLVNRGHIATYNEGLLEWATGDYTVLLSADDRLTPGSLTRAAALLDASPEVGFVYGHPVSFEHGTEPPPARTAGRGSTVWPGQWWIERRCRDSVSCITSPEVMVRTVLQKRVGGYDPELPHAGDTEMWLRLAANADVGYVRGVDQAYYRIHSNNMTKARTTTVDLRQRRLAFETFLASCGDQVSDSQRLSEIVHRKLSQEALRLAARAYDRGRTSSTPVSELVEFAFDCWPDAEHLLAYRGLRLRQMIGPRITPYLQPLVLTAVGRRAQSWWWWRSWERRGI